MPDRLLALREWLAAVTDLRQATGLLEWDQQTMMPADGAPARAEALATLQRVSHEQFISADTGRLLDAAASELDGDDPDSDDARLLAVTRRRYEKARRVPAQLAADLARAASVGHHAWVKARAESDFAAFAPYLEHNLELTRRYVECFDGFDCAYDVVLDDYEPGMRTVEVARLFDELKSQLVPLIATVSQHSIDDSSLHGDFPVAAQRRLAKEVVTLMGFDPQAWRMDDAVHPFALSFGSHDIRITARWDDTFFTSALYSAMHECGHGLYEAGIADSLARSPLGSTQSLGLHESQSRLWENMVGRGKPFSQVLAPMIIEAFDTSIDATGFYRAVNRVAPSYIRVEADEATYGLHIVLRFEFEQALLDGRLAVADLPAAWNARMKDYLGLTVPSDALGVLQDVHWASGLIGYFPTYALGNLIAGQLWQRVHDDIADLDRTIEAGELAPLRDWLRDKVHRHGAKFTAEQLLERVVGAPIEVGPFVSYLKTKLSDVYQVDLTAS